MSDLNGHIDRLVTQLQETGRCRVEGLLVAEVVEIIQTLGLDGRTARVVNGYLEVGAAQGDGRDGR